MATTEFLSLTDWKTGEPIYLDPLKIAFIQQVAACDQFARRTRIELFETRMTFIVAEDAMQVALASGRGFFGPKDTKETA